VLEETKLLEILGTLQRRVGKGVEGVEDGPPIGVHAHVLPVHDVARLVTIEGNGQPGEVEGIAVHVGHHLVRGAALHLVGRGPDLEGGDLDLGLLEEWPHQRLDVSGGHERLVSLDVHVDVGHPRPRDLPQPVRPRTMLSGGEDGGDVVRVAGLDDLVAVGGHEEIGEHATALRPPEDVDHHGHAADLPEHLARQSSRLEPSGDDTEDDHPARLPESRRPIRAHLLRWPPRSWAQRTRGTPRPRPSGAASHLYPSRPPAPTVARRAAVSGRGRCPCRGDADRGRLGGRHRAC
jgi:hypothetical protein